MEKIYMENNNKKKKSKLNGSVIISFSVALVAIISLVAFGFNQISYAADESIVGLGDNFTTSSDQFPWVAGNLSRIGEGEEGVRVLPYKTNDGKELLCIQAGVEYNTNKLYTKGDKLTDAGLIYLVSELDSGVNYSKFDSLGVNEKKLAINWIKQTAVWSYLNKAGYQNQLSDSKVDLLYKDYKIEYSNDNVSTTEIYESATKTPIYQEFGIDELISEAIEIRKGIDSKTSYVNIVKENDNISVTSDNKYYQIGKFVVTGISIGKFNSYSIVLKDQPKGTIVVDSEGNKINDLNNVSPSTQFYLRIPKDQINAEKKQFSIGINGNFTVLTGYIYSTTDNSQQLTYLYNENEIISTGMPQEIVGAPDTGMNTAQSIYFIGLIVLLSGVGIIYATVKPAKSN